MEPSGPRVDLAAGGRARPFAGASCGWPGWPIRPDPGGPPDEAEAGVVTLMTLHTPRPASTPVPDAWRTGCSLTSGPVTRLIGGERRLPTLHPPCRRRLYISRRSALRVWYAAHNPPAGSGGCLITSRLAAYGGDDQLAKHLGPSTNHRAEHGRLRVQGHLRPVHAGRWRPVLHTTVAWVGLATSGSDKSWPTSISARRGQPYPSHAQLEALRCRPLEFSQLTGLQQITHRGTPGG